MTESKFELSTETLNLLQIIESTDSESERVAAIGRLASSDESDAARVLMETFDNSMWRSTKLEIVRVLGNIQQDRPREFLIHLASDKEDLAMASEAILALGSTSNPVAGEFLVSILKDAEHPLGREAVIALTGMDYFPCEDVLINILNRPKENMSSGLLQYVILALGRRGHSGLWKLIKDLFEDDIISESGAVFNATLIAAGQLGAKDAIETLRSIDVKYRFFARQLKQASIERIQIRLDRSVEDALMALMKAEDETSQKDALKLLREFPLAEAWEAFELFGMEEASPAMNLLVRIALFSPSRIESDISFLKSKKDSLDGDQTAALLRLHYNNSGSDVLKGYYDHLSADESINFMARIKDDEALTRLAKLLTEESSSDESRQIKIINAMVAQAQMAGLSSTNASECGSLFLELINQLEDGIVRKRIIRALGQIGHANSALLIALNGMLKNKRESYPSIYSALAMFKGDEPKRIITKRLKTIIQKKEYEDEVVHAVNALAGMGEIENIDVILPLTPSKRKAQRTSLLKILSDNSLGDMNNLIAESIDDTCFQTRMLAIAAAKHNHSAKIWDKIFLLLSEANKCLKGRALDTITVGGGIEEHRRLIKWLEANMEDKEAILKIFRSLVPEEEKEYSTIGLIVNRMVAEEKGAFSEPEVKTAATNLTDNIALSSDASVSDKASKIKNIKTTHHEVDAVLTAQIEGFTKFSPTIKSILRNAELTFNHPEIFDTNVDKSTMLVQYVKSIDLLLQEKIGAAIFMGKTGVLAKMQSKIVQMQLDDESISASQYIKDLQCGLHFTPDTFPNHKLNTLSRSILSGRIQNDQYRTLDGLRAWALILLVFVRHFKYRGTTIDPLFKVQSAGNTQICEVTAHMNTLQGLRNQAAHRGTMVNIDKLGEIRNFSFVILNELEKIL